jgi:hypothetical protein
MLVVRKEQMAALRASSREQYQDLLLEHLQRTHPEESALVEPADLLDLISRAEAKADTYGLTTFGQIYQLIESTLLLGDDFDVSGEYPWAAELLEDRYREPSVKAAKLRELTQQAIADHMAAIDAELLAEDADAESDAIAEASELEAARDADGDP